MLASGLGTAARIWSCVMNPSSRPWDRRSSTAEAASGEASARIRGVAVLLGLDFFDALAGLTDALATNTGLVTALEVATGFVAILGAGGFDAPFGSATLRAVAVEAVGVFAVGAFAAAVLAAGAFAAVVLAADDFAADALPAGFAVAALGGADLAAVALVGALDAAFTADSRVGVFNATVRILLAPERPASSAAW
jgi:hypothetical protein